ncbi:alpha/beta hydrolase [Stieleria sp. TO1_6]|uniref:alpha/beta hydrolase n=1 Tax=Stieleria tagensis TaxID=2956795 RepID=UPI00209B21C5|nr:alpha/beta hydrolase [Stieleria tagensis]MCO8120801.1 alpha/beta hydrolase [Stieleria tagensis]
MIRSLQRILLDQFILRPSRHEIAYAPKQRHLVTADGMTDEFFIGHSPPPLNQADDELRAAEMLVLKFPGTAGRAERASEWPCSFLPDVTAQICSWNAPGYGRSSGRASLSKMAPRALHFWQTLKTQFDLGSMKVWIVGNSLGCATATYLAGHPDVRAEGLILRNPPPLVDVFKHIAQRYPMGRWTGSIAESLPPEMNLQLTAPRADLPTVMLQSELDSLVLPTLQMEIYDLLPNAKRLVVMQGLDHDSVATEDHEDDIADAIRWLWNQSQC